MVRIGYRVSIRLYRMVGGWDGTWPLVGAGLADVLGGVGELDDALGAEDLEAGTGGPGGRGEHVVGSPARAGCWGDSGWICCGAKVYSKDGRRPRGGGGDQAAWPPISWERRRREVVAANTRTVPGGRTWRRRLAGAKTLMTSVSRLVKAIF